MLQAVIHGKKRGTTLEGKSLLFGEFSGSEDVLTSSVFERLAYLDDLRLRLVIVGLPGYPAELMLTGPLVRFHFWPHLRHPDDGRMVEPDVLIEFQSLIVIVEAKRSDSIDAQRVSQLRREVEAVRGEFKGLPLVLIALGGLATGRREREQLTGETFNGEAVLLLSTWKGLFEAVNALRSLSPSESEKRILHDIRQAFRLNGVIHAEQRYFGTLISQEIDFIGVPPLTIMVTCSTCASECIQQLHNIHHLVLANYLMGQIDD